MPLPAIILHSTKEIIGAVAASYFDGRKEVAKSEIQARVAQADIQARLQGEAMALKNALDIEKTQATKEILIHFHNTTTEIAKHIFDKNFEFHVRTFEATREMIRGYYERLEGERDEITKQLRASIDPDKMILYTSRLGDVEDMIPNLLKLMTLLSKTSREDMLHLSERILGSVTYDPIKMIR